ncbi:hypothetical protein PHMEG_00028038, partial [Phytophthora megakarya]
VQDVNTGTYNVLDGNNFLFAATLQPNNVWSFRSYNLFAKSVTSQEDITQTSEVVNFIYRDGLAGIRVWHARLGHTNAQYLKSMVDKSLVDGMMLKGRELSICETCQLAKQKRKKHLKSLHRDIREPNDRIFVDLMDPGKNNSTNLTQILVIVDGFSRDVGMEADGEESSEEEDSDADINNKSDTEREGSGGENNGLQSRSLSLCENGGNASDSNDECDAEYSFSDEESSDDSSGDENASVKDDETKSDYGDGYSSADGGNSENMNGNCDSYSDSDVNDRDGDGQIVRTWDSDTEEAVPIDIETYELDNSDEQYVTRERAERDELWSLASQPAIMTKRKDRGNGLDKCSASESEGKRPRYQPRERERPKYLDDYVVNSTLLQMGSPSRKWREQEVKMPHTFRQSIKSKQAPEWKAAMIAEMDALRLKGILNVSKELPKDQHVISTRWPASQPQIRMLIKGVRRFDPPRQQKAPVLIALLERCTNSLSFDDPADQALWGGTVSGFFFFSVVPRSLLRRRQHSAGSPSTRMT